MIKIRIDDNCFQFDAQQLTMTEQAMVAVGGTVKALCMLGNVRQKKA